MPLEQGCHALRWGPLSDSWLGSEPLETLLLARGSLWPTELCEPQSLPELPRNRAPSGASGRTPMVFHSLHRCSEE